MDNGLNNAPEGGVGENLASLDTALASILMLYQDARSRGTSLRATALVSLGVLSAFTALAGPTQLGDMGLLALPGVVLVVTGLVCALAVLLPVRVSVPYESALLASDEVLRAQSETLKKAMVGPLAQADSETRARNKNAAWLVGISLTCFVAAVVILGFQLGLGDDKGLAVGSVVSAATAGLAQLLRWLLLDLKPTNKE